MGVSAKQVGAGQKESALPTWSPTSTFPVALVCIISGDSSNRYSNHILMVLPASNHLKTFSQIFICISKQENQTQLLLFENGKASSNHPSTPSSLLHHLQHGFTRHLRGRHRCVQCPGGEGVRQQKRGGGRQQGPGRVCPQ